MPTALFTVLDALAISKSKQRAHALVTDAVEMCTASRLKSEPQSNVCGGDKSVHTKTSWSDSEWLECNCTPES